MMISVKVDGIPTAQGSKRGFVTKQGKVALVESAGKKLKTWRDAVTQACLTHDEDWPDLYDGPVRISILFYMPAPKRHDPSKPMTKRPDLDKLVRAVLDSVTKAGLWADDSQVTQILAAKTYALGGQGPGCEIRITA